MAAVTVEGAILDLLTSRARRGAPTYDAPATGRTPVHMV
jgi:hypothetical protein